MNCEFLSEKIRITVLTLNCWGIPWLTRDYMDRMKAIAEILKNPTRDVNLEFDIICLQEVWCKRDFKMFKDAAKDSLPYSHYFYSGVLGSGVCIFSKWPIIEVLFHQWQVNGYMHKIFHGDWFGGKGVGLCRIDVNGFKINVFTAHLHAQYGCTSDEYLAHRVTQAFDTAQFIRLASEGADISVLAGDLNTEPDHLCYLIIKECADLKDAFQKEKSLYDGTFNVAGNIYSNRKRVIASPQGERIDHIFFRIGTYCSGDRVDYFKPLPTKDDFCFSDHEGIAATFELMKLNTTENSGHYGMSTNSKESIVDTIQKAQAICGKALKDLKRDKIIYWMIALPTILILLLTPIFTTIPKDYYGFYTIFSFVATVMIIFSSLMATVWNKMEYHGIFNTFEGMTFLYEHLSKSSIFSSKIAKLIDDN